MLLKLFKTKKLNKPLEEVKKEPKIHASWAISIEGDENLIIYENLCNKYKIIKSFVSIENTDDYDVIIMYKSSEYGGSIYEVVKNEPNLSSDELALICDNGNLCFGYIRKGDTIKIFID